MCQHWSFKVSAAEHLRDVSEMLTDLVAAFRIACVDVNTSAALNLFVLISYFRLQFLQN